MKRATLTDVPTGKTYDLAALIAEHEEVTIGRVGRGAIIQPGEGLSLETTRKTEEQETEKINAAVALRWVSAKHAIINHRNEDSSWKEGFYITDVGSRHGTKINDSKIMGDTIYLRNGDKIKFGPYNHFLFSVYEESA